MLLFLVQSQAPYGFSLIEVLAHRFQQRNQDLLGHAVLQRDPKYMVADGFLELGQRTVFVQVHAGGGLNIRATIVARRLGIGRSQREEAPSSLE